uniref:Uncharacterized protein n=1 Tax=Anguilla anguilla TaxID=7936 RepID=A0A0E9WSG7_ANGAN
MKTREQKWTKNNKRLCVFVFQCMCPLLTVPSVQVGNHFIAVL